VLQVKALPDLLTRKTLYIKIKHGNTSIKSTRQMRAQENTTQRKNVSKQSTKKNKKRENLMQNRTHDYKMMINITKKT
jgi:hypothetical protein